MRKLLRWFEVWWIERQGYSVSRWEDQAEHW